MDVIIYCRKGRKEDEDDKKKPLQIPEKSDIMSKILIKR